jgi:hypothetical protein
VAASRPRAIDLVAGGFFSAARPDDRIAKRLRIARGHPEVMTVSKSVIALTFAAIGALAYAAPAIAMGPGAGDARAEQEQAQLHPYEANQPPEAVPGGVAYGEVYVPQTIHSNGFIESLGEALAAPVEVFATPYEALAGAPSGNCQPIRKWTGSGWRNVTVCD